MGKKSTTLMILIATFLALGLTVYTERLAVKDTHNSIVVEGSAPSNYKIIKFQIEE